MTPAGLRRTWRSPAPAARLGNGLASAEPLPGNRAAIVSLERHDSRGPTAVVLRVLGEEGDVAPIVLGTLPTAYDLTTAAQPDGTMAIAVATRRGTATVVQATVIDPSTATANLPLQWIEISPPGAISPAVGATSEGFVVAWLEAGKPFRLHAREITDGRAGLYAITVGDAGSDAFFTMQARPDELTFLWMDASGQAVARSRIADVWDKQKAAVIIQETTVASATGTPLWTTNSAIFARGEGGFGGSRGPSTAVELPDRAPDGELSVPVLAQQALLYRLCGDRNPLHADPEFAARAGFERPILHGLCTYGMVCKSVVDNFLDGDVTRVGSFGTKFAGVVFPGETLRVRVWRAAGSFVATASAPDRDDAPVLADTVLTVV